MENKFKESKNCENKITDLEILINNQQMNNEMLNEQLTQIQSALEVKETINIKCPDCDFTSGSEKGLKTHIKKKHKEYRRN